MKRTISLLLMLALLLGSLAGCAANGQKGTPSSSVRLPKSIGLDIEGEYRTVDMVWTDNSCSFMMDKTQFLLTFAENCLTVTQIRGNSEAEPGGAQGAEAANTKELFRFTYDEKGYITGVDIPSEDVETVITYGDDYKTFLWDLQEDGMVDGTADGSSVNFAIRGEEDSSYRFAYDRSFLTNMEMGEFALQFVPETDANGSLTSLTVDDPEGITMDITPSDRVLTHSWQRIPLLLFIIMIYGSPIKVATMCCITSCYIDR